MDEANGIAGVGKQIERLVREQQVAKLEQLENGIIIEHTSDGKIVTRYDLMLRPVQRKEHVAVKSIDSFIDFVNRNKTSQSIIKADQTKGSFKAIFDYEDGKRNVLNHSFTAQLTLEKTLALKKWESKNNSGMDLEAFALFIEENLVDVVDPEPGVLMQVATGIRAVKDVEFDNKVKLENGAHVFSYKEEVKGTFHNGQLEVPKQFYIAIPLWHGASDQFKLECKLRYRVSGTGLTIWYSIPLLERAIEESFADVKKEIIEKTGGDVAPQLFDAVI